MYVFQPGLHGQKFWDKLLLSWCYLDLGTETNTKVQRSTFLLLDRFLKSKVPQTRLVSPPVDLWKTLLVPVTRFMLPGSTNQHDSSYSSAE